MRKRYLSLLLLPVMITGCSKPLALEFVPFSSFIDEKEVKKDEDNDIYYSKKDPATLVTSGKEIQIRDIRDLLNQYPSAKKRTCMEASGEKKILILPICFNDSDESSLEKKKTFIQNAFFGETKRTNYDSVVGYYNKSSFGHLKISGEVMDWYKADYNAEDWNKSENPTHTTASSKLVVKAVNALKEKGVDLSSYDTDGDGFIDGVYGIYDHPLAEKGYDDSLFWAYTYYAQKGENNNDEPYAVNAYSWTSVDTILQKDNKSYTNYLIHEVGHLFGLSDYYNTEFNKSKGNYNFQPTGCFDMMDYNIGDHSPFSKYLLGWISPRVIKHGVNTKLTLKPFTSSGECLLIPSSTYRDSPFGEYLMVEYFTPDGLNKFDGSYKYTDKDGKSGVYKYPQHYGLRIYHVNASIGYYQKNALTSTFICDAFDENALTKIEDKQVGLDYIYDNTIRDDEISNGKVLYHLLESSGNNSFKDGVPANNDTLFKYGDDFGITNYKNYTFSSGEEAEFTLFQSSYTI